MISRVVVFQKFIVKYDDPETSSSAAEMHKVWFALLGGCALLLGMQAQEHLPVRFTTVLNALLHPFFLLYASFCTCSCNSERLRGNILAWLNSSLKQPLSQMHLKYQFDFYYLLKVPLLFTYHCECSVHCLSTISLFLDWGCRVLGILPPAWALLYESVFSYLVVI